MNKTFVSSIIFLLLILVLGLYLASFLPFIEGLQNQGAFPLSLEKVLLNSYPQIGKNKTSNDSVAKIWWRYPIFSEPSFAQITNNLRYRNNPDDSNCSPIDFCGALYRDKKNKSNEVFPLPPAQEGQGARVNYYRTEPNLLYYSIPDNENILY